MPDISMCQQHDCPKRNDCYRYRAVPSELMQAYIVLEKTPEDCAMYWPISDKPEGYYRVNPIKESL